MHNIHILETTCPIATQRDTTEAISVSIPLRSRTTSDGYARSEEILCDPDIHARYQKKIRNLFLIFFKFSICRFCTNVREKERKRERAEIYKIKMRVWLL